MNSSAWIWIVILIIVIGGGLWWWMSADLDTNINIGGNNATTTTPTTTPATSAPTGGTSAPTTATVTYNGAIFSPANVTIKKGGKVTWQNSSSGQMWVASAQHPTHTVYGGTSRADHCASSYTGAKPFDQCAGGNSYSFAFDKVGKWNYHDHINASAFGSVTVVE